MGFAANSLVSHKLIRVAGRLWHQAQGIFRNQVKPYSSGSRKSRRAAAN